MAKEKFLHQADVGCGDARTIVRVSFSVPTESAVSGVFAGPKCLLSHDQDLPGLNTCCETLSHGIREYRVAPGTPSAHNGAGKPRPRGLGAGMHPNAHACMRVCGSVLVFVW